MMMNSFSAEDIEAFSKALIKHDFKRVYKLVASGADVNAAMVKAYPTAQHTLLHHAVLENWQHQLIKCLIDNGCNVGNKNAEGATVLHLACAYTKYSEDESLALVKLLLETQPLYCRRKTTTESLLSMEDSKGRQCMLLAIRRGHYELVEYLLQKGAPVGQDKYKDHAMLDSCCVNNSEQILHLLLKKGCKLIPPEEDSYNELMLHAIEFGDVTTVDLLHEYGANIDTVADTRSVHLAVRHKKPDILRYLLEKGCPVNVFNKQGITPLMIAAKTAGSREALEMLIAAGANLDTQDEKHHETALSLSVYFGMEDLAVRLIRHGADVNVADVRGVGPLYWAMFNYRVRAMEMLILSGAFITVAQLSGKYPRNIHMMRQPHTRQWLLDHICTPMQLTILAKRSIREALRRKAAGKSILGVIELLPLPRRLIDYLSFTEYIQADQSDSEEESES